MLQIFADALLIAARMDGYRPAPPHRPDPQAEVRTRRGWLSLSGLRR